MGLVITSARQLADGGEKCNQKRNWSVLGLFEAFEL